MLQRVLPYLLLLVFGAGFLYAQSIPGPSLRTAVILVDEDGNPVVADASGLTVQLSGLPVAQTSGTAFFSITDTGITTASENIAFGSAFERLTISAPSTNTADICVDHLGATAVCPAVDTAGDERISPGETVSLIDHVRSSISVIAASGTQTVKVTAHR